MRTASLFLGSVLLAFSAFGQKTTDQPPEHSITPAQVHEILELTGGIELAHQATHRMMQDLRKAFPPFMPQDVIDDLDASLQKIDVEPIAVKAYQRHISTEDAEQIIAFYKTPAGARLTRALPAIGEEVHDAGAAQGRQIAQEVIERHMNEINAAAEKYRSEHEPPPTVTTPN